MQGSSFGDQLRGYREAAGRTQEEVAEAAGLSARGLRHLERGERRPYPETARRLAQALALAPADQAALLAAARATPGERAAARHNLPAAVTSFIGREHALAQLRRLLTDRADPPRLVTLTGAGGCGKTRLALQVATGLLEHYAQRVWLVELAPLADPDLVPPAVAAALGLREEAGQPLAATLTAALRTRRLLLVLDNCEHLIARCATLAALLRSCPGVQILATSREALGLAGETVWRVPSLQVPDAAPLPALEDLAPIEAVRLFVERAQAGRPGFALTARTAPGVARICRRLDGIPLALELAAAQVPALGVEQLAARLDQRFLLLSGGDRAALPRQQTLRATVDWSYNLLSAGERALFNRLSAFAGGFTLEAAEAVGAGGEVAGAEVCPHLVRLVGTSLVVAEGPEGDVTRYRLLETLHAYAREALAARGEAEQVQARHAACFLALAEEAGPHLYGPEQAAWLARLEIEHDNVRAALRWAQESGAIEVGRRLAAALVRFWWVRGPISEGQRWLEMFAAPGRAGAEQAPAAAVAARARALYGAGALARVQGDLARATALHQESLALCREMDDRRGIASALLCLGGVAYRQGDYARAAALQGESLALFRELGDTWLSAILLFDLGRVARRQGDLARAAALHQEGLALCRELGNRAGIARSLDGLGAVARRQGDDAQAAALHQESLALFREVDDRYGIAVELLNLGRVASQQGDHARAAALHQESLALCREVGDKGGIADGLEGLARVATAPETAAQVRERGVRLLSAAAALRAAIGAPLAPSEGAGHECTVAALRAVLGEPAYEAAWAQGQVLSMAQAVALALDDAVQHGQ